ncbi:MAG TPA: winged helix-turn-helix domain-containing protein, partial [Tepidisphaeraceae bacterium]|nr:winged helix-turn-helix domain-containing protein [Tepidisphaeraceae bacterium]
MALTNESGTIVFDDIEIDIDGRRLTVDGKDVALEPKTFAVLVLLASNAGKTLTHDDILDAVWGHRHVTQNVLHRAIALLRQALGGRSPQRQYIHTVHGVGYRFDARVLHRPPPSSMDRAVVSADAPITAASTRNATEADPTTVAHPRRNRVAIAVAVCALLVFGAVFVIRTRTPAPSPSPTLVVLPLQVIGDDKNEAAFAAGLSEELTTQLARVSGLGLISGISATIARKDDFDPPQLASKLHTTHALEGSLREAGDKLR